MALASVVVLSLIVDLTNADYFNYHNDVGIPAAARIKERERREKLGAPDTIETRVVCGSEAPVGAYPWLAGLVITLEGPKKSVCGSSLVSPSRLVTAAHCWVHRHGSKLIQASAFEVVLGSQYLFHGGLRIMTNNVVVHHKWIESNYHGHDSAVIYLPDDIEFNENIKPIKLPTDYIEESFVGYFTIGAGYGALNDEQRVKGIYHNASIHHVGLTVITNEECSSYFENVKPYSICTSGLNGVGICQGDSGGPLVTYIDNVPILIGITAATSAKGCDVGSPSIFTRVTLVLDFISNHLKT